MKELIAEGMDVTAASKQALQEILRPTKVKPPVVVIDPDPVAPSINLMPAYVPVTCVNTMDKTCSWSGSRSIKTINNLKPCPKCGGRVLVKAVAIGKES